ncbi:aldo/keto reductase [Paraburkholderia sp.]|uniref:aldo/keto reductase n=1 Tax=Paraburkholderia sp. TaxID=1926495 RepID=UPI002384111A|nr:aldo/keto reductase [Paraburkholderia sp.]MDE1182599.1 aldo/keto reductase [Paraburkholderia sp.]
MEQRLLGRSGLKVPALSFGTANFGLTHEGATQVEEARRLLDICIEAGVTMFDTANVYKGGASEQVLGSAIAGRRDQVLISTKGGDRVGPGPNDVGSSRFHLINAVEAQLKRLGTDYIDLYQIHTFDALTPIEESLRALDDMVRAGKIRYAGVSNFSGWQLATSIGIAERSGLPRYVSQQVYYSLIGREYEWELMPAGLHLGVSAVVWSPLGWGRLTGRLRRGSPVPADSRLHKRPDIGPPVNDRIMYDVIDVLDQIAEETGRSIPQIALNWVLGRPTVASVIIGARNEAQLRENIGATGWSLSAEQVTRLDDVSSVTPIYPYWHQREKFERIPSPV